MEPDELNKRLEELYSRAQGASSEGLRDEALSLCREALELLEEHAEDADELGFPDFVMLQGDINWTAGDYEEAFLAYQKVSQNDPDRLEARVAMGVALFHLCRFQAAQTVLEMCSIESPDDGEIWYYLGLLALRQNRKEVALTFFETAHELQDNRFFVPVMIDDQEVAALVNRFVDEMPEEIHKALENVPIILEDRPDEVLLFSDDPPMDPLVLGIFEGTPMTEFSSSDVVTSPTRIVLFLENIWLVAHNRTQLEDELWITLKHEIGHYFGLDEDELEARGLD